MIRRMKKQLKSMFFLGIGIFVLIALGACNTTKKISPKTTVVEKPESKCSTPARLVNLSDCGMVFVLEDGRVLQALSFPDGQNKVDVVDNLRIDFKVREDIKTDCASAIVVDISCLEHNKEALPVIERSEDCIDVLDPFTVGWMSKIILHHQAVKVSKFIRAQTYVYTFDNEEERLLYDCYGRLLCRHPIENALKCERFNSEIHSGKILIVIDE